MSKKQNISDCSNCYSEEILIKYINDQLSDEESAGVEAHILECEICSDVLDGLFMLESPEDILDIQADLNKQIDLLAKPNRKILGLSYNSFRAVAAAAVLLIITGSFLLINNLLNDNNLYTVREISKLDKIEGGKTEEISDPVVSEEQIAKVTGQQKTLESKPIITKKSELEAEMYHAYDELDEVEELFDITLESDRSNSDDLFGVADSKDGTGTNDIPSEKADLDNSDGYYSSNFGDGSSGESFNDQEVGGKQSETRTQNSETETLVVDCETISKKSKWSWKRPSNERKKENKRDASNEDVRRESNMPSAPISTGNAVPIQNLELAQELTVLDDEIYIEEESMDIDYTSASFDYNGSVVNNVTAVSDLVEEPMGEPIEFVFVEVKPEFPGGDIAMLKFISDNYSLTETTEYGTAGTIYVQFVVDRDGRVTNVELVKGVDPVLDAEALRVVSIMPVWSPGMQRGIPVQVKYIIPMHIDLK